MTTDAIKGAARIELHANDLDFVAYEIGRGPLALCLHGFPDLPRSFRYQIGPLVEAGYRVVVPYMRGYAPTGPAPDGSYEAAALGRDVIGLLDALQQDKAVLIGHDWGATGAYAAAGRAPERVERLVVLGVPYGADFLTRFATDYDQLKRSWYIYFFQLPTAGPIVEAGDYCLVRKLWTDWSPGWQAPSEEVDMVCAKLAEPGVFESVLGYYRSMFNPDYQNPELASEQSTTLSTPITVPTLYMHGFADGCLGAELGEGMEAVFPGGLTRQLVKGAGHFLHLEKPDEVNEAILSFLEAS